MHDSLVIYVLAILLFAISTSIACENILRCVVCSVLSLYLAYVPVVHLFMFIFMFVVVWNYQPQAWQQAATLQKRPRARELGINNKGKASVQLQDKTQLAAF